jgi:hypothetical protein
MSSKDFGAFDAIINSPPSTQQASQGTLKGTDGGTTSSQPKAGMDEEVVVLFECVRGVCGASLAKGEEQGRFFRKDIVDSVT